MLICQMARFYRGLGINLYQAMQDLYAEYGFYHNRTLSFTFEGSDGAREMAELMQSFRDKPLTNIAGLKVVQVLDYENEIKGLPRANVIQFDLENSNKVIVRPSGTEPKVKVYIFTVGESEEAAIALDATIADEISSYVK